MKNIIHFLLTCFISTGALLSATKAAKPWAYFGVMAFVCTLFVWRMAVRKKRRF